MEKRDVLRVEFAQFINSAQYREISTKMTNYVRNNISNGRLTIYKLAGQLLSADFKWLNSKLYNDAVSKINEYRKIFIPVSIQTSNKILKEFKKKHDSLFLAPVSLSRYNLFISIPLFFDHREYNDMEEERFFKILKSSTIKRQGRKNVKFRPMDISCATTLIAAKIIRVIVVKSSLMLRSKHDNPSNLRYLGIFLMFIPVAVFLRFAAFTIITIIRIGF